MNVLLLGTYGDMATPFYLYTHKSNMYLSLKDINFIYFNQQLDTKTQLIKKMLDYDSSSFIREKTTGNILLLTRKIIRIARHFNCYSLAELCKLSKDEILGKVAQPLLNTIECERWKPIYTNKVIFVERDLQFESLHGDEWPVITPPVALEKTELVSPILLPPSKHVTTHNSIYKWLSFNLYENYSSPEMIQALLLTAKTSKQQQAIIEVRQRKAAFSLSRVSPSKQKPSKKKAYHVNRHNNSGANKPKLPPSPPQTSMKRKQQLPELNDSSKKRLKPSNITQPASFDNLTLLATQATQLRGLLLSPDVSPPPPSQNQQHRLPSLKTLLSDLKNHPFP